MPAGILEVNTSHGFNGLMRLAMEMVTNVTPNIGQTRMMGALTSQGIRVQRCRICHLLHAIDPIGTILRFNQAIYQRKYSVPRPNSLWHIYGNHKMIGWRMVIHACCIDGYTSIVQIAIWQKQWKSNFYEEFKHMDYHHAYAATTSSRTLVYHATWCNTEGQIDEAS